MFFHAQGKEIEVIDTPTRVYPDYKVYATGSDSHVHVDNGGEVIVYTSYLGYEFYGLNVSNRCDEDLGDRIEIRTFVGGTYYYFSYHISKETRKAIAYFDSRPDLKERQVDLRAYRIWHSENLGDNVYVKGMYGNNGRIVRKTDNSLVSITEPDGTKTTELLSFNKFADDVAAVRTENGQFHFNLVTMEPIIYRNPEDGTTLSYFDETKSTGSRLVVYKGWRKYTVDPKDGLITGTGFKWLPWFSKKI